MLNQSLYNYYLKEVLGVHNYIGQAQDQPVVVTPKINYQNKTIVVIESSLKPAEQSLLEKIMNAVSQSSYELLTADQFKIESCSHCRILFFHNSKKTQKAFYQDYSLGDSKCLNSISLERMLPPTDEALLKQHKQKLWTSLKLFFKG